MTYFEELQKDTEIIKALGSEILKSRASDDQIMITTNIVSDTVYRFKRAKEIGLNDRETYSGDALIFARDDIKTLKKIYIEAFFESWEKTLIKAIENVDNV